jgi:DNA sulfur modification protein DndB
MVREERAREIALAVLDQQRTFPNAIVLATDMREFEIDKCEVIISPKVKFLVVDGQHRLWAQRFSQFKACYASTIHMGLTEVDMARLFLEINDNQKRVPSSLRWDLVRLVRPEDDPQAIGATEIIYQLSTDEQSPLYQRIDLTGEQSEIQLKQASFAPEIRQLLTKKSALHTLSFDQQYDIILQYFIAIKALDPDKWGKSDYDVYKARVLRAFLRLLPDIIRNVKKLPQELTFHDFMLFLKKVKIESLDSDSIRALQGNAGIKAIYDQIRGQVGIEK